MGRLREAIRRLNPSIPEEAREEALRKVLRVGTPSLTQTNRAFHADAARRRAGGVSAARWQHRGRSCAAGGFRRRTRERLVGREPIHGDRGPAQPAAGHRGLRQRPAAGPDRAEERGGRGRDDLERLRAASNLQGGDSHRCCITTRRWWCAMACRRASARSRRTRSGSRSGARSTGERVAPADSLELEVLVRGVFERQRFLDLLQHFIVFEEDPDSGRAAQDHRGLPSVPRGERGGGGNGARQRHDGERRVARGRGHLLGRPDARRQAGRPSRGRGLAHAGQRQEFLDALLRRPHHPRARRCRTRRWWC